MVFLVSVGALHLATSASTVLLLPFVPKFAVLEFLRFTSNFLGFLFNEVWSFVLMSVDPRANTS